MVIINSITPQGNDIIIDFLTNEISISVLVKDVQDMTPQDIIETGYGQIIQDINIECMRLGIIPDHELPMVEDEIVSINLYGVSDIQFTEGQINIDQILRNVGNTKFCKSILINEDTIFSIESDIEGIDIIDNIMTISDITSSYDSIKVIAKYGDIEDNKTFSIQYRTIKEIEDENKITIELENARKAEELNNVKIQKKSELSNTCNSEILSGFTSTIKYGEPKLYDMNLENQINMLGRLYQIELAVKLGGEPPTSISYNYKGGPCEEFTLEEYMQLCSEAITFKDQKINKYKDLCTEVDAKTTIEEVNEIVW